MQFQVLGNIETGRPTLDCFTKRRALQPTVGRSVENRVRNKNNARFT